MSETRTHFSLNGLVSVVTGAGSGIGEAIAELFVEAGSHVFLVDVNAEGVTRVAERLKALHPDSSIDSAVIDVSSPQECRELADRVAESSRRCDVLVNNAGIGHVGTLLETELEDFQRVWSVNVESMYHLSRAFLPGMIDREFGSIVNMASALGLIAMADRFAYTVSKHAVIGLTRSMAFDFSSKGVRVNCICPGRVETPLVSQLLAGYEDPERYRSQMVAPHPIGRMAEPREIAAAALFLASPEASFVTGSALVVDGGYLSGK